MEDITYPAPSVAETLAALERFGLPMEGTSKSLIVHDGLVHRHDCLRHPPSAPVDIRTLLGPAHTCLPTTGALPGPVKKLLGTSVLRNGLGILTGHAALRDAPKITDLPSALAVMHAFALVAETTDALTSELDIYGLTELNPVVEGALDELNVDQAIAGKLSDARLLLANRETELLELCTEEPSPETLSEMTVLSTPFGRPIRQLGTLSDPLSRATFAYYVKANDALAIAPRAVYDLWISRSNWPSPRVAFWHPAPEDRAATTDALQALAGDFNATAGFMDSAALEFLLRTASAL